MLIKMKNKVLTMFLGKGTLIRYLILLKIVAESENIRLPEKSLAKIKRFSLKILRPEL